MEIIRLYLYNNIGYMENGIEKPGTDDVLPTPFVELNVSHYPSAGDVFRKIKCKVPYESAIQANYLRIDIEGANGITKTYYGWVESVEYISDNPSQPVTAINWHIDPWRTYFSSASFGSGIVTRRTSDDNIPHQNYSHRYVEVKDRTELIPNDIDGMYWVYLNASVNNGSQETGITSYLSTYVFPVSTSTTIIRITNGTKVCVSPTMRMVLAGDLSSILGIDPSAIYGAWISPIAPCTVIPVTIDEQVCYQLSGNWSVEYRETLGTTQFGWFFRSLLNNAYVARTKLINPSIPSTTIATSDTTAYAISDFDGQPIGTLPWGMKVQGYQYRVVIADTSAYISIRFLQSINDEPLEAPAEGLEINIPLKAVPISTNNFSSYMFSGQMEYDRQTLAIKRDASLTSGIASTGTSGIEGALSGAMMGGMVGAMGGPLGIGVGALIGAGTSMLGTAISTGADYAISGDTNAKLLEATKTLASNQTNSLMLPGSGVDWLLFGCNITLIELKWDDYSIAQRANDISLYGAHVYEPKSSCATIIASKGPLQIKNLIVTGQIPPYAKQYIANIFSGGVVIK